MAHALISLLALLFAAPALAREGPNNVVYVTAATSGNTGLYGCNTPDNDPYECCNNPAADTCDTTLNGADLCVAMETCEAAGGCRIQLPEGTVAEAEHYIYGTRFWTMGLATPCGGNFNDGFPAGLIIQGKGMGRTILQADVPGRAAGGARDIVSITNGGGLTAAELPRVVYQNMTIDGQSNAQPLSIAGAPQNGFTLIGPSTEWSTVEKLHAVVLRNVRVQRTAGDSVLSGSASTPGTYTGSRVDGPFHVLRSELSMAGCAQPHSVGTGSAHPGKFGCGCDIDGNCGGWNTYSPQCEGPNLGPAGATWTCCTGVDTGTNTGTGSCCSCGSCGFCPGQRLDGAGVNVPITSDLLVAHTFLEKAPHYLMGTNTTVNASGFGACFASHGQGSFDEFSSRTCGKGYHLHGNRFGGSGSGAIDAHGGWDTRFTKNTFEGTCFDDNWAVNACSDFTFANGYQHWVYMKGNRFLGNRGASGAQYNWWRPIEGVDTPLPGQNFAAPRNVVQDETFELDCNNCGTVPSQVCAPANFPTGITDTVYGTYAADLPPTDFLNLQFTNDNATNNCTASLYARSGGGSGGHRAIYDATFDTITAIAGGRDSPNDKTPGILTAPSANRIIAYFNYLKNSRVKNLTAVGTGTGGQGKVTFGVGTPFLDDMSTSCRGTITWQNPATAALNDRTSGMTSCP